MKNLYVLGPEGTISNEAANKINENLEFRLHFIHAIEEIGKKLSNEPDACGVLPIENSITGIVGQAQELLVRYDLSILRETKVKVAFTFITNQSRPEEIELLYCHPIAYNQCSEFISEHIKDSQHVYTKSNIESADIFFDRPGEKIGAIIPSQFYQDHNLEKQLSIPGIEIPFPKPNRTRFLQIQRKSKEHTPDFSRKKTSLFIENKTDKHSILFYILREFHTYEINLILLHSRPHFSSPDIYCFFIDFLNNKNSAACLNQLEEQGIQYRILGTYDPK